MTMTFRGRLLVWVMETHSPTTAELGQCQVNCEMEPLLPAL